MAPLWVTAETSPLPFVSPIFGDYMVLQRGKPNAIWGWSQQGDTIRVTIGENSATTSAGPDGKWLVHIDRPVPAGPFPESQEPAVRWPSHRLAANGSSPPA